jgi:hypothetical protein
LRLFNAVAMLNLIFECEVWGPWALQPDMVEQPAQNIVEQVRLSFLKVMLGLEQSLPHWRWNVCTKLGMCLLQIFVARQQVLLMFMHASLTTYLRSLPAWAGAGLQGGG